MASHRSGKKNKSKPKRKNPRRRAAAKNRRRDRYGRFLPSKKSKKTKNKPRRRGAQRGKVTNKKGHRGQGAVSFCVLCKKPIFGGAKGMNTHYARHHGVKASPRHGVGYSPHQKSYMSSLRDRLQKEKDELWKRNKEQAEHAKREAEYEDIFKQP